MRQLPSLPMLLGAVLIGATFGALTRSAQPDNPAALRDPKPQMGSGNRGREATAPGQIPTRGWRDIVMRTYEQIGLDRVMAVAAGVTFYALLGLFPATTALVSLYGLFADRATVIDHLTTLAGLLPSGAIEILSEQMTRIAGQPTDTLSVGFTIGLLVALWSANQGMKAIFDALNVAYGEREKRSFIRLNVLSLSFTVIAIVFVVAALATMVVLPVILEYLPVSRMAEDLLKLARWPIMAVVIVLAIAILYRHGPSRRPAKWRWIWPGAVLAALVWIAASIGFTWYVGNFGSYNETYGSLGAVIGFMTWIWVSATIVLVGAELNAEMERQTLRDSTQGAERSIGSRGATVADTIGGAR